MLWEQQQVISQTELPQLRNAPPEFRQQHEVVILLIMEDMPDARQFGMLRVALQLPGEVRGAQVHPADDAFYEVVFVCQLQQPLRFLQHLPRLHGDGATEPNRFQQRLKFLRQVIATQHLHIGGHPGLVIWMKLPKMLMGVDAHLAGRSQAPLLSSKWTIDDECHFASLFVPFCVGAAPAWGRKC